MNAFESAQYDNRLHSSIVFVIGGHDRRNVRVFDYLFERIEKDAPHRPLGKILGDDIRSIFGLTVHKMFGGSKDMIFIQTIGRTLQTPHRGNSHLRDRYGSSEYISSTRP